MSEAGQFDDAPGDTSAPDTRTPGTAFIDDAPPPAPADDDARLLEWSDDEDEDEESEGPDEADFDAPRVEDEDWEMAERDFTKQYNRLRQHVAVRTGANAQQGAGTGAARDRASAAPLPALNRPPEVGAAARTRGDKGGAEGQLAALSKYAGRLARLDWPYQMGVATNKKVPSASANAKDKSDRATSEQVLDPRTRLILFKMIGRGLIQEVNGCVSTGKEANVYHALAPDGAHLALKIFKTSILVFKDRDKYVAGEYRFRRGYNRHNPRKMVRLWAEKEMRNLKRLVAAGLPAPTPIEVRENVLVMSFLGDAQGWASPRLKDAEIAPEAAPALYAQLVRAVRTMFHVCRLVHADLSEYNVLLHRGAAHVIDVSQAVEHDHPHAFDFLRADVRNLEAFFARTGARGLGARRCFEFVVRADVCAPEDDGDEARALERWIAETPQGEEREQDDEVFLKSYIPRTLNEVFDPERDVEKLGKGEGDKLIYADTIGLVAPGETKADSAAEPKAVRFEGAEDEDGEGEGSGGDDDDDGSEDEEEDPFKPKPARGHRNEDKDAKKERKQAVKAEARERRKTKMPKAEKKKKIKNTARA